VPTLFSGLEPYHRALDFHLERHNLLAANVAHVDTPNYKPRDLERTTSSVSSFERVFQVQLERTNLAHLASASAPESGEGRVFTDLSAGGGADGNFVSLDREASKLAANQLRYDIVSVLVSSELQGLTYAASDTQR
jgi:flagellar basal-body rod protein FlgB